MCSMWICLVCVPCGHVFSAFWWPTAARFPRHGTLHTGDAEGGDLQAIVARLQAELSKAQAEAAESHQANLTLGAELAVLERKQRNQVGRDWLHMRLLSVPAYLLQARTYHGWCERHA